MDGRKKKIALVITLSVVGVIVIAAIVLGGIYFFSPKSDPKYIAHRGYSDQYLGNTAEAFRAAAEMNFYGIETDVRKTADGIFVCNHDESVKFADGDEKTVSASTYAELAAKPLKNSKNNEDLRICTLEEYLTICKEHGKVAIIELKETFSLSDLRAILTLADAYNNGASVSIISFYFESLMLVRQEAPSVNLQYLSETKNDPRFERCLKEGISISVRQSILTTELVDSFHQAGLTVNTWTVNKTFDQNIVRIKGVDYVTTDRFCDN